MYSMLIHGARLIEAVQSVRHRVYAMVLFHLNYVLTKFIDLFLCCLLTTFANSLDTSPDLFNTLKVFQIFLKKLVLKDLQQKRTEKS